MLSRRQFIRNGDGPDLLLQLLVCAVATVLGIRFYLHLTGYPQIGGGGLHIAHMLWGGLLMLAAVVLLLGFLGHYPQRLASIVGGIGFGAFIDELGKFVTRDNNYFFQPTVGLIYVIFVLLAIAFQAVTRITVLSDVEYRVNALRAIEEAIVHDLTPERSGRLRGYLARARPDDPIWTAIAELASVVHDSPSYRHSWLERAQWWLREAYRDLVEWPPFPTGLAALFLLSSLLTVWGAISRLDIGAGGPRLTFQTTGELCSSLASAGCALLGVLLMRRSRLQAFALFRTSVLIALLSTEFFVFLAVQFAAVPSFAFNFVLFLALGSLIQAERTLRARDDHVPGRRDRSARGA